MDSFQSFPKPIQRQIATLAEAANVYLPSGTDKIILYPNPLSTHASLIGFIAWRQIDETEAELLAIAVHSAQRQKGIGRLLLENLLHHCKLIAVKQLFLEVRKSNLAAQTLYHHQGFTIVGTRKNYYLCDQGFEDAYVMKRTFL
ncbi:ribosomal protein S18-alanine N-acetyltransferase [Suttonella ornithocola]|uniref:[Ribosomal protein bS18]-alanine N-acetyltransferase n=1 Tax=Suttonella ornithocola TaxID=279832 RepID=A0A380MU68_9GAMM|nr:ribosomal protein S18-alanine N-acetyltransferase [Suttonella ornithocola]SUO95828.1 ribosomal-protein-alanine N-acetyltransferase [Suttonella ornithocola]